MQIVVDANVIVSLLISPGKPIDLFFSEELELFAPEILLKEIQNNKDIILEKSKLSEEEISSFLSIIRQKLSIIPEEQFLNYREFASKICPDPKDITYFALALHLHCPLWTNEKKLKEQNYVAVYATHELMKLFNIS